MKILADLHHFDLFYSLQLLFEKRLGWELYRPIGLEWYTEGYWNVYPHPDTAKQYLSLDQAREKPVDIYGNPLPSSAVLNLNYREEDGIFFVEDPTKDVINRGITLEKFKSMDFDILVSSIPQHIQPFNKLINLFQPRAKHIFQVGNAWGHLPGVKNILASAAPFSVPSDINICFYHQEFDTDIFRYEVPQLHQIVNSYIHYMRNPELFNETLILLNWNGTKFGAGMDDLLLRTKDVAERIRNSAFTWHWKPEGDGYGFVIHSSYAMGRPAVVNLSHYRGKLAEKLFTDDVTCINTEGLSPASISEKLLYFSEPERHRQMCEAAYQKFCEVVNFDDEEKSIREFLRRLK